MTRRIALYARVSTMEQAQEGKTSIQKQLDAGALEVSRMEGFGEDVEIVKTYIDAGVSGSLPFEDRLQGSVLLTDARRGKFDTVIFYSLDRFTRSASKGLQDFETMEDGLGLTLVFARENIDTSTASGKLFRTMLMAFSEFERDQIRDRIMGGRHGKAKTYGAWVVGKAPFGYQITEDGTLEIRAEEAAVIELVFYLRAKGVPFGQIAKSLEDKGIRPRERISSETGLPIDQKFSASSIQTYIRNTAYKAKAISHTIRATAGSDGEEFTYDAPRIVSTRLWRAANDA